MLLTREQILAVDDRRRETVKVPAWKGEVLIREMSVLDRTACYAMLSPKEDDTRTQAERAAAFSAALLVHSLIQEDGSAVLSAADAQAMTQKADSTVAMLVARIQKLNKIDDAADTEKN